MSAVQDPGTRSRDGKALAGERRLAGNQRVTFEAFVEVGAESVGGFEAESINISPEGIRLRTAYLPELGDRLVCRFDGFGGEVMAEGQVIWCKPQGRGGEFGVQFTRLDEFAAQVLESMCAPDEEEEIDPTDPPPDAGAAARGARVRLHIQGLGSPMRARVRDVAAGEVLIGSNLEFLKVGRDVELEDVDGGASHTAQIEHVDVAIDPETNIPQLIVALRCGHDMMERAPDSDAVTAPIRVGRAVSANRPASLPPEPEITPEPMVTDQHEAANAAPAEDHYEAEGIDEYTPAPEAEAAAYTPHPDGDGDYTPVSAQDGRVSHCDAPPSGHFAGEPEEEGIEDDAPESLAEPESPPRFAGAKRRAGQLASRISPALNSASAGAKSALGNILTKVRAKRRQSADRKRHKAAANAPKRRTAPPPSGALRSDGKRLFRESNPSPAPKEGIAPRRTDRKRAIFGAVLGVAMVVGIYAAANQVSAWQQGQEPLPALSKVADGENPAAAAAEQPQAANPDSPIATANVPLFGATPLSTTEPVPVPPNVDMEEGDGESDGDASGDSKKKLHLEKEWGVGTINDPTVLKLKMDGPIEGIAGAEGATGFTLVVPNRKSISSAAGLARKDKRIESVNVVNYPDRAEVTVMFKGDVPAFLAKAKGKRLIIEVGSSKASKSSKKTKKRSKSKSSRSKSSKSKKRN